MCVQTKCPLCILILGYTQSTLNLVLHLGPYAIPSVIKVRLIANKKKAKNLKTKTMTGNNMCVQYVTNILIIFKSDFKKSIINLSKHSDLLSEKSQWFALLNLAFKLLCPGHIFCSILRGYI